MAVVASVQYGSIALTASSGTATITSVSTTKAVVVLLGYSMAASLGMNYAPRVALTNATTVTATRTSNNPDLVTVSFIVIEFVSPTSLQAGTISIAASGTSGTATITSVDATKAIVFFLGFQTTNASSDGACRVTLTNATTVTADTVGGVGETATVGYTVVEL